MKRIICIVLSFLLLSNALVFASEPVETREQLPQKIIDILNGSDELYLDDIDDDMITPEWASGGRLHTHQYLTAYMLHSTFGLGLHSFMNDDEYATIMAYSDNPDTTETDTLTFVGHFIILQMVEIGWAIHHQLLSKSCITL